MGFLWCKGLPVVQCASCVLLLVWASCVAKQLDYNSNARNKPENESYEQHYYEVYEKNVLVIIL